MPISFFISGVPPKKDGANSMWNKGPELARLKALRGRAKELMNEYEYYPNGEWHYLPVAIPTPGPRPNCSRLIAIRPAASR